MSLHTQHVIYLICYLLAAMCWLLATVNVAVPRPNPAHPSPRIPFNLVALGLLFFVIPTICAYFQIV